MVDYSLLLIFEDKIIFKVQMESTHKNNTDINAGFICSRRKILGIFQFY